MARPPRQRREPSEGGCGRRVASRRPTRCLRRHRPSAESSASRPPAESRAQGSGPGPATELARLPTARLEEQLACRRCRQRCFRRGCVWCSCIQRVPDKIALVRALDPSRSGPCALRSSRARDDRHRAVSALEHGGRQGDRENAAQALHRMPTHDDQAGATGHRGESLVDKTMREPQAYLHVRVLLRQAGDRLRQQQAQVRLRLRPFLAPRQLSNVGDGCTWRPRSSAQRSAGGLGAMPAGSRTRSPSVNRVCRRPQRRRRGSIGPADRGRHTTTGHAACLLTDALTEPSTMLRNVPLPRDPMTIRWARGERSTKTCRGSPMTGIGTMVRSDRIPRPGPRHRPRSPARTAGRRTARTGWLLATSAQAAARTSPSPAALTTTNGRRSRSACSTAHWTARAACSEPSTATTTLPTLICGVVMARL